jgi:hypothetical protein
MCYFEINLHTMCYGSASVGLWPKGVRETVERAADKLATTAADTKSAVTVCAAMSAVAIVVAVIALIVAVRS